jgi:hypothetical protein
MATPDVNWNWVATHIQMMVEGYSSYPSHFLNLVLKHFDCNKAAD